MNAKTLNKLTKDALVQEVLRLNNELTEARQASGVTQRDVGIVRYRIAEVVDLQPAARVTVLKELDSLFR
tara:strand:+ start:299 stop:508 length:210 start_codon:yes stop_codon:yes gene_type:complete